MGNHNRIPMRILLIDDDGDVRKAIADFLGARGHAVVQASNGTSALSHLRESSFDIVITDIKLPGADGFDILTHVKDHASGTEVIMMTGFGDIDIAVRAMREGAFDFFSKPVKMQELAAAIERTERFHTLRKERDQARSRLNRFSDEARRRYGLAAFVGESVEAQAVKALVQQVCRTDATSVLLSGETGTGKEVIARAIHHESARADGPFIAVDCTAIPDTLFESVFYGYEKGAFTDARESRQRPGDILLLARHYLDFYAREMRKEVRDFAPEVLNCLQAHPFPGNVRELKNTIERAVILCQIDQITPQNLQFSTPITATPTSTTTALPAPPFDFNTALQTLSDERLNLNRIEADLIQEALRRCNGNKGTAADLLGLSRFALRRRMSVHGME